MILYFDIETIPANYESWHDEYIAHKSKNIAPAEKPGFIDLLKSTDPMLSRILCVSYKKDQEPTCVLYAYTQEEEEHLIQTFAKAIVGASLFVHYNGLDFDAPFVITRARKYLIQLNYMFTDLRRFSKSPHYDIMHILGNWRDKTKLDFICKFYNIPTPKDDISGAEIYKCFLAKEHSRIINYSTKDCDILAALHKIADVSKLQK